MPMVRRSQDQLGNTGRKTGFGLGEFTARVELTGRLPPRSESGGASRQRQPRRRPEPGFINGRG